MSSDTRGFPPRNRILISSSRRSSQTAQAGPSDNGVSGSTVERPRLSKALDD